MIRGFVGGVVSRTRPQVIAKDEYVCWSRMQAEAGQGLDAIIRRKEIERQAGDGCFAWGVGNPPAHVARVLARAGVPVRAVFSVMKSKPKLVDVAPTRTVVWRRYVDADGAERALPAHALVTSRGDSASGAKQSHYALMCRSSEPLSIRHGEPFDPAAFRNAGGTGAPVGASQVTALLRRVDEDAESPAYEANIVAWLTGSYWVRLTDPADVEAHRLARIDRATEGGVRGWREVVTAIRSGPSAAVAGERGGLL